MLFCMKQIDAKKWKAAVASTLRAERAVADLSQVQVSERTQIARTSYRLYEEGKRQPDAIQLAAISAAFGVRFSYLIGEIERRAKNSTSGV